MGFYSSEIGYKEVDNPALKFYQKSPACRIRTTRNTNIFRLRNGENACLIQSMTSS